MYKPLLDLLIESVRPRTILRNVGAYWNLHSTVNGPGLSAVSKFLAERHQENGVAAEVRPYPADNRTPGLDGHTNPLSWAPRAAKLEITAPDRFAIELCSYAETHLSLISYSAGTPPEGVCAEVVVVHNATTPEAFAGIDVRGKIVLTDVWPMLAQEQSQAHGAVGLVTDSVTPPWLNAHPPVRMPADVPDLTMWGTLSGRPKGEPFWGFSLTPRQGAVLRKAILENGGTVMLKATIDAELFEGTSEVMTAFLPGSSKPEEEIWILSHTSEPGALDNASGCCSAIEVARLIKTLVESGKLPAPARTIRFLSAVETEGYLPYLQESLADLPNVKAALAYDSVGSDFRQTGGTMRVCRSPDVNLSFVDDVLEKIQAVVAAEQNVRFSPDNYDVFPISVDPCFPGNDNMIADGFFDIPTPMLVCWPDKFYHSNLDTPDKLSIGSMARATVICAAYTYLLAAAGLPELREMAQLTSQAWKRRILAGAEPWQAIDALLSLVHFDPAVKPEVDELCAEMVEFTARERASADHWGRKFPAEHPEPGKVPARLAGRLLKAASWHAPAVSDLSKAGQEQFKLLIEGNTRAVEAWRYVNGRRTAADICVRCPLPPEITLAYLDLMVDEQKILVSSQ